MAAVGELTVRRGGPSDQALLYELFDEAVEWLVERGQAGQWGETPPSQNEDWRRRIHAIAVDTELWLLEEEGLALGALAVGPAPYYVPVASEPELYIHLLITRRTHKGRDLGGRLLEIAERAAERAGADVMRVDCWAGSPSLLRWYEARKFERCGTFDSGGWPGQIFRRPVA